MVTLKELKEVRKYLELSLSCLSEAEKMLNRGDFHNASEKLWGAAAHIVKALAEKRGWKHSSHGELFKVMSKIESEMDDPEFGILFSAASSLHQNFYENWMTPEQVKRRAKDIEKFIEKMKEYGKLDEQSKIV